MKQLSPPPQPCVFVCVPCMRLCVCVCVCVCVRAHLLITQLPPTRHKDADSRGRILSSNWIAKTNANKQRHPLEELFPWCRRSETSRFISASPRRVCDVNTERPRPRGNTVFASHLSRPVRRWASACYKREASERSADTCGMQMFLHMCTPLTPRTVQSSGRQHSTLSLHSKLLFSAILKLWISNREPLGGRRGDGISSRAFRHAHTWVRKTSDEVSPAKLRQKRSLPVAMHPLFKIFQCQ